jgi:peroxiredoxin
MVKLALVIALAACGKDSAPAATVAGGEGHAEPYVQAARAALIGRRAPAVELEMLDGGRVDLADVLGQKPIYLKFWATWCVPCREQMPHFESTFRAHRDKLAVFAVDVATDDPIENVREMVTAKKLTVPVAIDRDGSISEQFFLNVTPQHVLIDKAGTVRFVGHAVTPELERAIAALVEPGAASPAPAPPPAPAATTTLALDNGTTLDLARRPRAPIVLTFATLFCDSYIADSRPAIGAACAAHARQVEALHRANPDLTWVIVAYPVWTGVDDVREYRKRLDVTVPIGIDRGNAWYRRFHARDSYTTIVLDADGTELGRVDGAGAELATMIARTR